MTVYNIIDKKKRKKELSAEEIDFIVSGAADGSIPDYQLSAFLMAVYLNGMTFSETVALTGSMMRSGDSVDLCAVSGIKADKHSTGGVSDATTFIVGPVAACMGMKFAKLSGRGLGHTGGTLDKLESFRGFNCALTPEKFISCVNDIGIAVSGQTANLVPADKKFYALRDVTATIDSLPLIASSIMSKKLVNGADVIVLDVKYGSGAFMKTAKEAEALSRLMVDIGKEYSRRVTAVITCMDQPLGEYIGNALEVRGAIEVLLGKRNDLYEVSKAIVTELAYCADIKDASNRFDKIISSHEGYNKFKQLIISQGGDFDSLKTSEYVTQVFSDIGGIVASINAERLGQLTADLGGGRHKQDDIIDHTVGLRINVRLNEEIREGGLLLEIYHNRALTDEIISDFKNCFKTGTASTHKLIHNVVR